MNLEEKAVWVLHRLSDSANDKELLNLLLADASSLPEDIEVKAVADWLEQKCLIDRWDISLGRVLVRITPLGRDYLERLASDRSLQIDADKLTTSKNSNASTDQLETSLESKSHETKSEIIQRKDYQVGKIAAIVGILSLIVGILQLVGC